MSNSYLRLSRGARDQHHFEVRNTGNVEIAFAAELDTGNEAGLLQNPLLIWDMNGNGVADAGEPALSATDELVLDQGESAFLIYSFDVTAFADPAETATTFLMTTARSTSAAATPIDAISPAALVDIVVGGLELQKSVVRRTVADGDELSFTLNLRNNSEFDIVTYDEIDGDTLRIDGAAVSGILVRDAIPLNTSFVAFEADAGLTPLYHLRGAPTQEYVTVEPTELADIDAVAFYLDRDYAVGRSSDLTFSVLLPEALGTVSISNIADTYLEEVAGTATLNSNEIVLRREADDAISLDFTDPTTGAFTSYGELGADTSLQLISGACNISNGIDTVDVTVVSRITGDSEVIIARETGANTGIFNTTDLPLAQMDTPVSGDGVLASVNGDTLSASIQCDGQVAEDALLVNPGNFVFNSVTNAPITDATVQILDASGTVVQTVETDSEGFFAPGSLVAGNYSYEVVPSATFTFPSVRPTFVGMDRNVATSISFGGVFSHSGGLVHRADLPVDPFYGVPLSLEKTADTTRVRAGEFVTYTVTATNNMDQALIGAEILDRPPFGTELVSGTVRLDGQVLADPTVDASGDLRFDLDTMTVAESNVLTYVLRFTALAGTGRNYNTAILDGNQAGTGTYRASNTATNYVNLDNTGGVFADEGTILGAVFLDCNENGLRDGPEELGVPGVKLATQTGLFVVTDADGQFSLFGLSPVSHVLSILPDTLPIDAEVRVTRAADMLRGGTRMVALTNGEVRTENFALDSCAPTAVEDVNARIAAFAERAQTASQFLSDLPMDASTGDRRSIRTESGSGTTTQILRGAPQAGATPAADLAEVAIETAQERQTLESIIKTLDPEAGFMGLEDGDTVLRRTTNIRVKGPADLTLYLSINDTAASSASIGELTTWERGNIQAIEFIAMDLQAGENSIVLTGIGPFGNERMREEITIFAPGDPERLDIVAPAEAAAIPGNRIPVVVRILDGAGTPVEASATVTLRAQAGLWDVTDIRPNQPGVQAYIDNGEATFDLIPPQNTGPEVISVESSFGGAETEIVFTPNLDERILVGIIEGAVALNGRGDLIEESRISPFEETATGLRGEVYLKGRIRGDALLTLSYSSDRDTEDRLFRDIRGDEYYPVYGDNSERGFDAQSSSSLFVKIEKGDSYVLYGDIAIEAESDAFELGGYSRVTTGGKAHWQEDGVSITIFAARTTSTQRVVEVAARGVSGPYDVDLGTYVEGSERVDILVRDEDTGEIITEYAQRRGNDYVLDFFRDALIFNTPVNQTDTDGNPISIRVTYEVEEDGAEAYWLYGGEVNVELSETTTIGARVVHADADSGMAERERIYAAYIRRELSEENSLLFEIAQAEDSDGNTGNAARIEFVHEGDATRLEIEASTTGTDFNPTGSSTRAGADEVRVDFTGQMGADADLRLSARYIADHVASTELAEADLVYTRRLNEQLTSRIGVGVQHDFEASDPTSMQLLLGVDVRPQDHPGLALGIDLEQTIIGDESGELSFDVSYEVRPGWTALGQVDFGLDREGEVDKITRLQMGMEYQMADGVRGRTEFSANGDNLDSSNLVQGMRGDWDLTEQWSLGVSLEHTEPLDGNGSRLTSLALGTTWEAPEGEWIVEADLDQTFEEEGSTFYTNLGTAYQINDDLTFLGRSRLALDKRGDGPDHLRHRARIGLAYRPVEDARLDMLAWYEHQLDQSDTRSDTHMWSIAGTYEVDQDLRLNGKYAGQLTNLSTEGANGIDTDVLTQLVQGGLTWDFDNNRWEAGLNLMQIWDNQGARTNAAGIQLSYVMSEGTMLSFGYNHSMGELPDSSPFYQDGLYLRLRIVLDHSLWDRLDSFLGE
ncbi:DUF11 domain-containing protein [Monaibacterium marinum]|uniref:DUF11 domain-containing protein n=1 Tax=Pontivivens marinum TaxID=1690039 RepID=UPI0015E08662|nr:DUF11 domain-containing protein [Monaibacterium marinum]